MKKRRIVLYLSIFLLAVFCEEIIDGEIGARKKIIVFLRTHGFGQKLDAGVRVSKDA